MGPLKVFAYMSRQSIHTIALLTRKNEIEPVNEEAAMRSIENLVIMAPPSRSMPVYQANVTRWSAVTG